MDLTRGTRVLAGLAFCCASAIAAQSPESQAKGEIRGFVVDSGTSAPLAGVEIFAPGRRWRARSDERGQFRLTRVDPGKHVIVARKAGFSPESLSVTLDAGDATELHIVLRAIVAMLGEVVVRERLPARLQGFEHRRTHSNGGHFITQQEIERRSPLVTADLLRRVRGVKMLDSMGTTVPVSSRGPKLKSVGGRLIPVQCVLRVGVDGYVKDPTFAVNYVVPKDIYGIEVYAGPASIPAEFNSGRTDAFCGLIMIWTRSY